ncbi:MAG: hypothetical protein HYU87_02020 [Chloroflexi bacterium]|nr:hypothetical protein [Chloroflexota bacterium]
MSDAELRELRGVCEAFRSVLCSRMRISRFRLEVLCPGADQHSVLLVEGRIESAGIQRRVPLRRPAVMTTPVRDAQGVVASITLWDDSRAFLPASARDELERVAAIYAPMVRACLHAGGSWPRQNVSRDRPAKPKGKLSEEAPT